MDRVSAGREMLNTIVGIGMVLAGAAFVRWRRPFTRYLMRIEERRWGLEFAPGEPRTWFVALAGLVLAFGGVFVLWRHGFTVR